VPAFNNRPVDVVLDVRSKLEFFLGHLDGAENIPVDRLPDALEGRTITTTSRILVYCASGARSAHAAALLKSAGYGRVVDGGGLAEARAAYQSA
jgi:phage shock protein E